MTPGKSRVVEFEAWARAVRERLPVVPHDVESVPTCWEDDRIGAPDSPWDYSKAPVFDWKD